jgi:hypothetical protein
MNRTFLRSLCFVLTIAGMFSLAQPADAFWHHRRVVAGYAPAPVAVGYVPVVTTGYAPIAANPVVTAGYAPTTAYFAPAPVTTYYAPVGVTTYYAPVPLMVVPRAAVRRPVIVYP